jgi:deoxyribodipyrimidine photolyase
MTSSLIQFVEALRQELQQYGEMLALLDIQSQQVAPRAGEDIQRSIAAINAQIEVIQSAREQTRASQRRLAESLEQAADCGFSSLIPLVPEPYGVLVDALVRENHELLERVRQRAEQNQALLGRSLHSMQHFITAFAQEELGATPPSLSAMSARPGPTPEVATI